MAYIIIVVLVLAFLIGYAFLRFAEGNAKIVVEEKEKSFRLAKRTGDSIILKRRLVFKNIGSQAGTISDCFARTQLPYEQYDGMAARGKAERVGEEREDDYFEAYIITRRNEVEVDISVELTARKGLTLEDAARHMVDMPVDVIYTWLSRSPYVIKTYRIILRAEDVARAVGVTLATD